MLVIGALYTEGWWWSCFNVRHTGHKHMHSKQLCVLLT